MSQFVAVPTDRLEPPVLLSLLEDYASRDGTDYGIQELSLAAKVQRLQAQLEAGLLLIVCDLETEQWDLIQAEEMAGLECE